MTDKHLRFPIGEFEWGREYSHAETVQHIETIAGFPDVLEKWMCGRDNDAYMRSYRPGGWTAWQVIHHLADSHMNSFCRFKLALTEESPVIKPYWEDKWAELSDVKMVHPEISAQLLTALHYRWMILLNTLKEDDFARGFVHPEHQRQITLREATALYAWHCSHHFAHLELCCV